jgi:HrpA-like RNA helicase
VPGRLFPVNVHYINDIHAVIKTQQSMQSQGSGVVREDALAFRKKNKPYKGRNPNPSTQKAIASDSNHMLPYFNAETVAEFIIRLIEKENSSRRIASSGMEAGAEAGDQVVNSKAVLVFLSGIQAITSVMNILRHRQTLDLLKAKV